MNPLRHLPLFLLAALCCSGGLRAQAQSISGPVSVLFSSDTPKTLTNNTTDTSCTATASDGVRMMIYPADWRKGRTFKCEVDGSYQTPAVSPGDVTTRVFLNSTSASTQLCFVKVLGSPATAGSTDNIIYGRIRLICLAVDPVAKTAQVICEGFMLYQPGLAVTLVAGTPGTTFGLPVPAFAPLTSKSVAMTVSIAAPLELVITTAWTASAAGGLGGSRITETDLTTLR